MVRDMTGTGRYPAYPRFPAIAFYTAVRKGDPEMLALVMRTDPYFITQDNGGGAPVHFATTYRQLDMLHHLLNNGAEVNQRDRKHGFTALHRCAALAHLDGYLEIYEYLLSRGADPSIQSEEFDPYLHPGRKLPVDLAVDDPTKAKLRALESTYASVPKAREPHPDIACFWTLYDYGLETVKAWPKEYRHSYPEELKRQREKEARAARREAAAQEILQRGTKVVELELPSVPAASIAPKPQPAPAPIPASSTAFLFPGQGSQIVGMAKDAAATCPQAKALFDTASAILGYDLLQICTEGPKELLDDTVYSQPALFVASLAAVEKLRAADPAAVATCSMAAGLSLGEYTALVFAGAMDFSAALRVVKVRAEAMARCAKEGAASADPHGMLSVVGLPDDVLNKLVADVQAALPGRVCEVANYLFPTGRVASGHKDALEELARRATAANALKAAPLAVSGAFHTVLMAPARAALEEALAAEEIRTPRIPVLSNVTGKCFASAAEIRALLPRQLMEPVQWEASLTYLVKDARKTELVEVGPGKQLKAMVRRIDQGAWTAMKNVEP